MTAEELIARAAACRTCGREHQYRRVADGASWAADDGHPYRPVISTGTVVMLRYLATGVYTDPREHPVSKRPENAEL